MMPVVTSLKHSDIIAISPKCIVVTLICSVTLNCSNNAIMNDKAAFARAGIAFLLIAGMSIMMAPTLHNVKRVAIKFTSAYCISVISVYVAFARIKDHDIKR